MSVSLYGGRTEILTRSLSNVLKSKEDCVPSKFERPVQRSLEQLIVLNF